MTVTASAPTRVDLAGGTIDIWPLYLLHPGAQTVNAALTIRTHVRIDARDDAAIELVSADLGRTTGPLAFDALPDETLLSLPARLAHAFGVRGVTITTHSEAPAGAGIAGSSALNIAVTAALARWVGRALDADALLEVAKNVEAQVIRVPTGLQDYRPALYGGIAALEMGPFGASRIGLDVSPDDLSDRLALCYTGAPRQSGINNWEITKRRIDGDQGVTRAFDAIVAATAGLRDGLVRGDWPAAGRHLADEWATRKQLAPGVTTPLIDHLLDEAMAAGAWAGKVCGAGGGGCVFALTPPERRQSVLERWRQAGATILDARVDGRGLEVAAS